MIDRRAFLGTSALALAAPRLAWSQNNPYVLGALYAMSGPAAEFGRIYIQGTELALEHLSADKWLKRPVVLKVEDSQGLPQAGALGITKLINVEKADYVLTGFTGVSKAVAPMRPATVPPSQYAMTPTPRRPPCGSINETPGLAGRARCSKSSGICG